MMLLLPARHIPQTPIVLVVAACLLLLNANCGSSDDADPTAASSQIMQRMKLVEKAAQPSIQSHELRLRALVLRDKDNGTALISFRDSNIFLVKLRRADLRSTAYRFDINGTKFFVKDFSAAAIRIQSPDTKQELLIR